MLATVSPARLVSTSGWVKRNTNTPTTDRRSMRPTVAVSMMTTRSMALRLFGVTIGVTSYASAFSPWQGTFLFGPALSAPLYLCWHPFEGSLHRLCVPWFLLACYVTPFLSCHY